MTEDWRVIKKCVSAKYFYGLLDIEDLKIRQIRDIFELMDQLCKDYGPHGTKHYETAHRHTKTV